MLPQCPEVFTAKETCSILLANKKNSDGVVNINSDGVVNINSDGVVNINSDGIVNINCDVKVGDISSLLSYLCMNITTVCRF